MFGEIGFEVTAQTFVDLLRGVDGPITLHINSLGGAVSDGFAIYNAILSREVDVVIEGFAASMASIIAMAGNTVRMHEVGQFMIHDPVTVAFGDAQDFRKIAENLDQLRDIAVSAYQRHTPASAEQLIEWMQAETWFTSQEALDAGFIDEVIAPADMLPIAACAQGQPFERAQFKNMPIIEKPRMRVDASGKSISPAPSAKTQRAAKAVKPEGGHMTTDTQAAADEAVKKAAEAAMQSERDRVTAIAECFAKHPGHDALREQCITNGVSIEDARAKLLDKLGDDVKPIGNVVSIEDARDKLRNAAIQWIGFRSGQQQNGKRIHLDGDNPFRGMTMMDLARQCAQMAGVNVKGKSATEVVFAAITHSTSDFPNILQDAMHKSLLNGFNTAGDTWSRFCKIGDLSDFRPHYRHILGSFSDLLPLNENGEVKQGTLDDSRKETITASTRARILSLSFQMIKNDDMGVFSDASMAMGRAAKRSVENAVYELLALGSDLGPVMSDGATLFDATHGNVTTGVPSTATFAGAIEILQSQTLPNASTGVSEYLDLSMPPIFVGPIGLAQDAKVINESQFDHDGTKLQKPNKSRGLIGDIVGTPRRTGAPWYLFANPSELPVIEVGFVDGEQEPQLVMQDSFEQYGMAWRVVYNYGVAAVNWLGAIRSTGA